MEALDDMIFEYMYRDGTETTRPERIATFNYALGNLVRALLQVDL